MLKFTTCFTGTKVQILPYICSPAPLTECISARLLLYIYIYIYIYARLLRSRAPLPPALAESIKQRDLGAQCTRFTGTTVQIRTQKPEALCMLLAESIKQHAQLTRFTGTKAKILTQKRYAAS